MSSEHKFAPSVNIALPPDCEGIIRRRVEACKARGEIEVWTTVIHDALWQMRNRGKTKAELRHELEEALLEGINSGPAVKYDREEFRARADAHLSAIHAGLDRNYEPMTEVFQRVIARTLRGVRRG
jgi:Arc/MetJ-type ribon-helix-helix transcriptional regulator